MPAHTHALSASTTDATTATMAANEELAKPKTLATSQVVAYAPAALVTSSTQVEMASTAISAASGGSQAHNNVMPYLAINYLICIQGIYPSRP
jgi:microcystin-dependent protein